jgi:hypothetical protein
VTSGRGSSAKAILIYTALRIGLFAIVWVLIEFVTPIHGIWAVAAAILISGAISIVVLDRPRNKVGLAAGSFFGRINERIEASARAVDDDLDEGQQGAQSQAVDKEQDAGLLEGGDQRRTERPAEHDAQG